MLPLLILLVRWQRREKHWQCLWVGSWGAIMPLYRVPPVCRPSLCFVVRVVGLLCWPVGEQCVSFLWRALKTKTGPVTPCLLVNFARIAFLHYPAKHQFAVRMFSKSLLLEISAHGNYGMSEQVLCWAQTTKRRETTRTSAVSVLFCV